MTLPENNEIIREPDTVESLKKELEEVRKKSDEYLAGWQRAQADFVNYKRRTEKEKDEIAGYASGRVLLAMLPIIDDLERAFKSVPPQSGEGWLEGFRMIERKFKTTLDALGLKPVDAAGQPFDPNFHEAVRQDKGKEGIVLQEVEKGYMLNGKLLRPSRVIVGNGEEATEVDSGDKT